MSNRKTKKYSEDLKIKAVEMYLSGNQSYRSVCDEFGIVDKKNFARVGV